MLSILKMVPRWGHLTFASCDIAAQPNEKTPKANTIIIHLFMTPYLPPLSKASVLALIFLKFSLFEKFLSNTHRAKE